VRIAWLKYNYGVSYLLFIDESGQDHRHSPYEVLAGVAVQDSHLWRLVCDIRAAEEDTFGMKLPSEKELKARELLKRKTFRLARQLAEIPRSRRSSLARAALMSGSTVTREQLTALAQAKIDFAHQVLRLCAEHNARFFASIVEPNAPRPIGTRLRKDYAYLFERFFYFLEEQPQHERGLVVFDELERSRAHILIDQMSAYFQRTYNGQLRVSRIVPEPLFVHSDLTTGIQVADLAAYIIAWNIRFGSLQAPRREELDLLGQAVLNMRHRALLDQEGFPGGFSIWSFAGIDDLRPRIEREVDAEDDLELAD
jgi:hypothetical protein